MLLFQEHKMHAALVPLSKPDSKNKGYPQHDPPRTFCQETAKKPGEWYGDSRLQRCCTEGKNGTEGLTSALKQDANILLS